MSVRPICPLCLKDINPQWQVIDIDPKDGHIILEDHPSVWIHNPKYLHEDILVEVHKECHDLAKAVYPNYDRPVEADWNDPKIPKVDTVTKAVTLKNLKEIEPKEPKPEVIR